MTADFPTFTQEDVRDRNTRMRDFKHFQRMMKVHPLEYEAYPQFPEAQ